MDCRIRITNGQITGSGRDPVGTFSWSGNIDWNGNVNVVKQYHGKHHVTYRGQKSGNTINGTWTIDNESSGTFSLTNTLYRTA